MKSKWFLYLVAAALIWGGGQALYTTATNVKPTEYNLADYILGKPGDKWLKLTGCEMNLLEASYFSFLGIGTPSEIYLPVRPQGLESDAAHILVATKDPEILDLFKQLNKIEDEDEFFSYITEKSESMVIKKDITGLIRFGIGLDSDDKQELQELNENLSEDFVIIDEGEKPAWHMAITLPFGLILLAYLLGLFGQQGKTEEPAQSPAI